jgi:phosphatidylinositol-3-phosphatase
MTGPRVHRVQAGRRQGWTLPDATAPAVLAATLLGLILVGAVSGAVLRRAGPTGMVDRPVEFFVVGHRQAWLNAMMPAVTDLGAAAVLVPLVLAAGLGWRWRRGSWRPPVLLGAGAAGAWVVQVAVKQLVERPRPPTGLALSHATGFAFPSGHATKVVAGVGIGAIWIASLIVVVGTRIDLPARPGRRRAAHRQGARGQHAGPRSQPLPADGLLPIFAGGTGGPTRLRWRGWAAVAVLLAAALTVPALAEGTEQAGSTTPAARVSIRHRRPQSTSTRGAAQAGAVSHVVLVVEENHEFGQIIGSRKAPFLNRLATEGTLLTGYYAIGHPSLPNYIALVAGDPLGIHNDCRSCQRHGRTLVDQLQAAGISWKAYYQGLPAPCSAAARAGAYVKKVDPFLHLDSVRSSPLRCRRVVPLTRLNADLGRGRLPWFAMLTPDLRHDMHSGSIRQADTFLHRLDRQLLAASPRRSGILLIVTFDEGSSDHGLHGRRGGGHVATIVVGPGVPAGARDPAPYDHYALLRSLERRFGLRPLRHAADRGTRTIPAVAGPSQARAARRS